MIEMTSTVRVYPSVPLHGTVYPPTSKYHTLRSIVAALLATGSSVIHGPAESDDTGVLVNACRQLGGSLYYSETPLRTGEPQTLLVDGTGGRITIPRSGVLDVGNAGAVLRLLLGICALSPEPITLTTPYPESLGRRPNADLLQALAQLGARIECESPEGRLPIRIQRGGLHGGKVRISGKKSSQYISSLLVLAPLLEEGLEIEIVDGLASASFVNLTIEVLQEAGITVVAKQKHSHYVVPGGQQYQPMDYTVPGDYPSAAALLAAVAVTKGEITIANLPPDDEQGKALLEVFSSMGVRITHNGGTLVANTQGLLHGVDCAGGMVIDSVPVIVAAACFASQPSRIYNVANLRLKESDRIYDLAQELNALGCRVTPSDDALEIVPLGAVDVHGGVTVDAHSDHRLIQALSIAGLASKRPVTITHAEHIAKSYPRFFADLSSLGAKIEWI
ncbi:MAG TPA: 3-phosphoshikimate 1-carboxyvinyltransferase [Ktedonobacteraceae bacterium]|nr:3-phosphoshikimate 1-carboxyvinyltransferase [Ktedonobacteraceae bacterium]